MSKKPDYLTLCSIAAQKAGTSYGKYMAMPRIPSTNSGRCGGRGSPTGHFQNLPTVTGKRKEVARCEHCA